MSNASDIPQVDHLFLLVGENPLPNYVATRTLLREGGTPYLVHTTHTEEVAKRICELLEEEPSKFQPSQLVSLGDHESDSDYIYKEVCNRSKSLKGQLGLNYTGGTKPMAVHAYRTLAQSHPNTIFSYLDPRRLEMCVDCPNGDRIRRKITLKLSLEELFRLHHLEFESDPVTQPKLPDITAAFVQIHCEDDTHKIWQAWRQTKFEVLPIEELPPTIQEQLGLYQDSFLQIVSLSLLQNKGRFVSEDDVKHWMHHNDWFEHYVLHQVQTLTQTFNIHKSAASFHVKDKYQNPRNKNNQENSDEKKFEIDVAFLRAYQLFAISCTTSRNKATCKEKLFEVYLRAKQLGGDEARVALVCFSDDPELLEQELKIVLEVREDKVRYALNNPKIRVFGREHLANLADEIAAWIERNDLEAK